MNFEFIHDFNVLGPGQEGRECRLPLRYVPNQTSLRNHPLGLGSHMYLCYLR